MNVKVKTRVLATLLTLVALLTGHGNALASDRFDKEGIHWTSHQPTFEEPWFVVNWMIYDNQGKDSFFKHDKGDGTHEGPALYINDEYVCSPNFELAWPSTFNNGHYSALDDECDENEWWGNTYSTDKCTIRFYNPYHETHGDGKYIRVKMYVFLKQWEVGKTYTARIHGKWKINDTSEDWEDGSVTSKKFAGSWSTPVAEMTNYKTVSVKGSLPGKTAATTVSLYTQSQNPPSGYISDEKMFSQHQQYYTNVGSYSGLTTTLERTDNSSDPFCAKYDQTVKLPIQYSATVSVADYVDKDKKKQSSTVYQWFKIDVPGWMVPKNAKYATTNQWYREGTVTWDVDESNNRSKAGTWTIRNASTNDILVSGLSNSTRSATISQNGYKQSETIEVCFVPTNMSNTLPSELKTTTSAMVTPTWAFGPLTAEEVTDGIKLDWTNASIEDAAGDKSYKLYVQRSTDYEEGKKNTTWTDIKDMDITSKATVEGTYTDPGTGLESNTTYHYRLKVNIFGEDQLSDIASRKLSGSYIESFSASRGTYNNVVKLQWNVKQVGATTSNFAVYRRPLDSGNDEDWRAIYTTSGTITSYSFDDETALPGSFNQYRLVLWNQDGDERSVQDAKMTDGFSVSTGIISGNIAYGTGTAVEGAKVTLSQQNADGETTNGLRSVHLAGYSAGFKYACEKSTLQQLFGGDFSVQMYVNPSDVIPADHESRNLLTDVYAAFTIYLRWSADKNAFIAGAYVGGKEMDTDLTIKPNEWTNLTLVHTAANGKTTLYAVDSSGMMRAGVCRLNGKDAVLNVSIRDDDDCISIGNEASFKGQQYYSGYMDEFRFWTKALGYNDIMKNYNHPLSGSESALAIYYPFDEGLTNQTVAYDFSRKDGISNNRHATTFTPSSTSTQLPDKDMMSLMSYTDVNGYYEIRGVPFSGEGTSYNITPALGIHEFSPSTRSRFVNMSSLIHSGVDFEDVSSFPVSGKIYYAGTDYPVEGVNFYVDGNICAKDGEIIATNENGEYTISVPIGDHFISVAKSGHVFANAGRYPADPYSIGQRVNFNQEIKNLEFIDSTLVNFTGRVVGGDIEGDKDMGFGLSKNNIGITELVLTPVNSIPRLNVVKQVTETTYSYETNTETVPVASATSYINSKAWRGAGADDCRKIFIHTDSLTGEFSVMVPPLDYTLSTMNVVKTGLEVAGSQNMDLSNPLEQYTDTVKFDDGTKQTYTYNKMLKQVYHSTPTFNVVQNNHRDDGVFGIDTYTLEDEIGKLVVDDIYSFDNQGKPVYKYGGPVFEMCEPYTFEIEAYEEYVNPDGKNPAEFHVPLSDLVVTIDNALSDQQPVYTSDTIVNGVQVKGGQIVELQSNQLVLDSLGCATYKWFAGLPNITAPYTRTITISYDVGDRTYLWSGSGMEGVVLGDMPTGNNFVTAGPDMLDMILRDPPGSKSSATWSSGTVTSTSHATTNCIDSQNHLITTLKLGLKSTTAIGMGVSQVIEAESKFDQQIGLKANIARDSGSGWTRSVEATKEISTSDDNSFDGALGDVFVGSATNIIYGKCRNVGFHRINGTDEVTIDLTDAITTGMEFSTMFNYTQSYIENQLIPHLKELRNSMLQTVDDATLKSYVNNDILPVYLTTLSPDDPNFGSDNTDKKDSKGKVIPSSSGNSYTMFVPQNSKDDFQDSIMWCNTQIRVWEEYLAQNEREKVRAFENRENKDSVTVVNYSFDSGSNVSISETNTSANTSTLSLSGMAYVVLNGTTGFATNGFGMYFDIGTETGVGRKKEEESSTEETATFSYTLAEEGDCDALTVDVYKYGSFAPIFRTRGGQTSAPYEGQVLTKYYRPGTTIMEATMQIEVPNIEVDVPVVSDIPSGSSATYTLRLSNQSDIDTELYYRLMMAEDTNPNGAQLFVDGRAMDSERLILIPGGQTVTKMLQLKQTDPSILDYERIGIVLGSETQSLVNYNWDVITDTVFISAHFVPSSSPVTLELSNNIMNTQTGTDLVLTMKDFDRNYHNLKAFRMQYKMQGATDWTLIKEYVLDEANKTSTNELLPASGSSVSCTLPMASFADGDYLFRVVSASTYGADEIQRYSEELSLVKDLQRPTPIGIPEPSDGILDIGDELSVTFNEEILKGELTPEANFRITGVLNGSEIDHETALSTAGGSADTAAATTEADISLAGQDFSIDAWVNLNGEAGTLFSHGKEGNRLTVGVDKNSRLVVNIDKNKYVSNESLSSDCWSFLSISMTSNGLLNATVATDAYTTELFKNKEVGAYNGNGPLSVGNGIGAAIHELLLWDEAHDMTTALVNRSKKKNPSTRHLIGYWKMDEGEGTSIRDYARNRHMTMANETWYLNNANKAISLNGQSFISIDASTLPICVDDDYALEFWMRGNKQAGEAQLIQMGEVSLSLNAAGALQLVNKPNGGEAKTYATNATNIADNAWHHVALNVLRQGSAAVYVDGRRCLTTTNSNVGSIATNSLIVGARRTLADEALGTYTYDNPFTGQVDEVRVWNATLSADKLSSNRKVRLTGSEDGLVAYYPFEKKTLDEGNQVITVGDAADLTGSQLNAELFTLDGQTSDLSYTDDAPALKTKPTETNVSFTFVASSEKIVITINEDPAAIEGTTLNFTVRDVRDTNGNYSVPASWSAFVNRKELAWAEDELTVVTSNSTGAEVKATIVNKSGSQQMWTLSGMPSWLTVSEDYGTTNPLGETDVTFTVSPATPIGKYQETIYLEGNNGIETPLTLFINVTGDVPAWSVNPNRYESSMNIIARVEHNGVALSDEDDVVAAFIGEECRGVAHPQYVERYDSYFITMDIYGDVSENKEVVFRAYDASQGIIYPVIEADRNIRFEPLALAGRYDAPVVLTISDKMEQATDLKEGWNWISFYVKASDMTPTTLLKDIASDVLAIKSQNSWLMPDNEGNLIGSMTDPLNNTEMYAIQMSNARKLRIVGDAVDAQTTPINLAKGWNWTGYYLNQISSLGDAFADMNPVDGEIVKGQSGVSYFNDYEWTGSLLLMEPGAGYMVNASEARAFSYPGISSTSREIVLPTEYASRASVATRTFTPVDYHNYSGNAIMAARLMAYGQPVSNVEVGIFADDECRAAAITDHNGMVYLTIPGDDNIQLSIRLAVDGEIVRAAESADYESDAIIGSLKAPFIIDLSKADGIQTTTVDAITGDCYDLSGRKLFDKNGDRRQLSKGIYIINGKKKVIK